MTDWMAEGACRGMDANLFVPAAKGGNCAAAKAICADCPVRVRVQCAEYAIADPSCKGIWGGLSERDRRNERARRGVVRSGGGQRKPINHDTVGGYNAHLRRGEDACDLCKAALARDRAERKRRKREQAAA